MSTKTLKQYYVTADRETGEWRGEPEFNGETTEAEWNTMADTDSRHFDTYEVDGETRAIEVLWED